MLQHEPGRRDRRTACQAHGASSQIVVGSTSVASISRARATMLRRNASSVADRERRIARGVGDRHPSQDAVRPYHPRDRRQRRHEHRRDPFPLELLRQRCPATRACASGAGEDHGPDLGMRGAPRRSPARTWRPWRPVCRHPRSCRTHRAVRRRLPHARARAPRRAAATGWGRRSPSSCRTLRAPIRTRRGSRSSLPRSDT